MDASWPRAAVLLCVAACVVEVDDPSWVANGGGAPTTAGITHGTGGDSTGDAADSGLTEGVDETDSDSDSDSGSPTGDAPPSCGNGVIDDGEVCDGNDLNGESCDTFGFESGSVSCTVQCAIDTAECQTCGDGIQQGTETCDGNDVGVETCETMGFGPGALMCSADCGLFDTSGCAAAPACGDGVMNANEDCDGADLGGSTCITEGFDSGVLQCTAGCQLDTSGCVESCKLQGEPCFGPDDCCNTGCGKGGNVCVVNNQHVCCS